MSCIDTFSGPHAFLSNFHPSVLSYGGIVYPTVEHAFQAQKTLNLTQQIEISQQTRPAYAKAAGRRLTLRPDWEAVKLLVMRDLVALKFFYGTPLADQLLATGAAYLVEGNTWRDRFWGVDGHGQNWLGILLMARRSELGHPTALTLPGLSHE